MPAGAAEPIIEIEMPERSIEIIKPHEAHNTAAEPDTFRVARGTVDGLRGLSEFVCLALAVLGNICGGGLLRLVLSALIPALGNGASKPNKKGQA